MLETQFNTGECPVLYNIYLNTKRKKEEMEEQV